MPLWSDTRASMRLLGEEPMMGTLTDVIALTTNMDETGYELIAVWIGRDDGVPRQIEFYGADLLRRFRQGDVRMVNGIPVAHHGEVETLGTGTHTVIDVTDVRFDEQLDPEVFTQRGLERGFR